MLDKVHGMVFRCIPFRESSVILQVFTQEIGLHSYLLNNARKPRSGISPHILQPLHQVELVAYSSPRAEMYRVKEIKNFPLYRDLSFNPYKSSLVLFLNEVLVKCIRQHQRDIALFEFICNALFWLDVSSYGWANFHILFLLQLSRYLGFYPSLSESLSLDLKKIENGIYFDFKNGSFISHPPLHLGFIGMPIALDLYRMSLLNFEIGGNYPLEKTRRQQLLNTILDFYAYQVEGFGNMKSLEVLTQVFEENL